jgi:hypothetical protein
VQYGRRVEINQILYSRDMTYTGISSEYIQGTVQLETNLFVQKNEQRSKSRRRKETYTGKYHQSLPHYGSAEDDGHHHHTSLKVTHMPRNAMTQYPINRIGFTPPDVRPKA